MPIDLTGKTISTLRLSVSGRADYATSTIWANENDVCSRYIKIQLFDDNKILALHPYTRISLCATLPNGIQVSTEAGSGAVNTIDNTVIFELTEEMLSIPGMLACDIELERDNEGEDTIILTCSTFYILVKSKRF